MIVEYAKDELMRAGFYDEDADYGPGTMAKAVLDLLEMFAKEEHSGASAMLCIQLFERLARFKPLTSLTGEDDEWNKIQDDLWQNKRCFSVFKNPKTGEAWDNDARYFVDEDGMTWTNAKSTKKIEFPYFPPNKAEAIHVKNIDEVFE